jgi:nucleoid-associated protein YgaU
MMFERFPMTSRYHRVETAVIQTAAGKEIVYLKRRFVPPPESFSLLQEHTVVDGDRLDNLTHQYLGDPEQFWRICDANNAMLPNDLLTENGRSLRITLPEGIPGAFNA